MTTQEEALLRFLDSVQQFIMDEDGTEASDERRSIDSNVNTDSCNSPNIDLETEISVSEETGSEVAITFDEDISSILINSPPEILRGKYFSMPGKKPKPGLNLNLPPISRIEEIFDDISINAERNGFGKFLEHIGLRDLRVATMCSGTEAPLLALEMVMGSTLQKDLWENVQHAPFIQCGDRSFQAVLYPAEFLPDIIFRDVNELIADEATTAFGSLRKVPANLDLLVVGFSCVDFSNMNLHRKTLHEMGESGHTFYGVLRYTQRCRPPLVILENVCGAPWDHIRDVFKEMDYHAYHIKVDTKNYYLPQARERGYMVCIDQKKLETPPTDSKSSTFAKMMKNFERPASSPVTQFLLKHDDPRLQDAIDDISSSPIKDRQAVDWTRYKARHLRAQTERVWDTLDINYLRSVIRGFDINFKSRIIDLSQGVDRELDQRASGITGCLTPRGQHFVTSRGGPLLGIEALALQGIPIDKLLLSNDTQRDLNDLAGNAMSSTVVGAAIMSALIIGYQALSRDGAFRQNSKKEENFMLQMPAAHNEVTDMVPLRLEDDPGLPPDVILEIGKRSARMCICEGQVLTKRTDMLICLKCGLTACKSCGCNPAHVYSRIPRDVLNERICPLDFETQLKRKLPMRLRVNGLSLDMYRTLQEDNMSVDVLAAWKDFCKVLLPALGDELRFQGVTRQRFWTIAYAGSLSVLKLVSSSTRLQWFLYLTAPKKEPSNSPLRQILLCPIASMIPYGENILNGIWHIKSPVSSYFDIAVSGSGDLVPTIGSRAGLKHSHFTNAIVWNQISISTTDAVAENLEIDIRGEYELLQDCGASCGSLHKKMARFEQPVYFILDPTEIGPTEFDSWVFALDHGRLDIGESRNTIAEVRPSWDSSTICNEPQQVRCWFRKTIPDEKVSLGVYSSPTPPLYRTPIRQAIVRKIRPKCMDSYVSMLTCSVPASGAELAWEPGTWRASNLMGSPTVLSKFAWLLQRAHSVTQFSHWNSIYLNNADCSKECGVCAPRKPQLIWALDAKDRIYAYENPADAALYEQSIKRRPATFLGFTKLDHDSILHVRLCLNVMTLIHQARGKLTKKGHMSLQWRLSIDNVGFLRQRLPILKEKNNKADTESEQPPGFKFFKLRSEQLRSLTWMKEQEDIVRPFQEEEVVEAMLPAINWRAEAKATTKHLVHGGILGDDVGYGKTAITLGLIDSQYTKDSKNVPSYVEGAIPIKATLIVVPQHLVEQWSREITKFLGMKYNILEIKSIVSLRSLTIRRFEIADIVLLSTSVVRGASYYERMELFAATSAVPKGDGRIFDEWLDDTMAAVRDNVKLLLANGPEVVLKNIIKKQSNRKNSGVYSKFTPSRRLKGQKFQDHLLKLREKMRMNGSDGVLIDDSDNQAELRHTIPQSKLGNKERKVVDDKEYEANNVDAKTPKAPRAKKMKGRSKFATEGPDSECDKTFQFLSCNGDWKGIRSPLIHMFEYSRLVVDEFTYSKDRNHSSVLAIPARRKWIISGTPPLNDFADVKSFSPLLGITLGVDDDERARTENERLRTIQRGSNRNSRGPYHSSVTSRNDAILGISGGPEEALIRCSSNFIPLERIMGARLIGKTGSIKPYHSSTASRASSTFENDYATDSGTSETDFASICVNKDDILYTRDRRLDDLVLGIIEKLRHGFWLSSKVEATTHFDTLISHLERNGAGDLAVTTCFHKAITAVRTAQKRETPSDIRLVYPKTPSEFIKDLNSCADSLRRLVEESLVRIRATRLFHVVQSFQNRRPTDVFACSSCFQRLTDPTLLSILGECGHAFCEACIDISKTKETCRLPACNGRAEYFRIIKYSDIAFMNNDSENNTSGEKCTEYGGIKFLELIRLIQDTDKIQEDEHVLLFIQFPDLMEAASAALRQANISHLKITVNDRTASSKLADFQAGTERVKNKVLILRLGDVSASGLNLQNANHVIFFHPLLAKSQYDYTSGMAQAIGRSRRYGQQKHVHLYHFLALKTIEVNIHEQRRGERLVKRDGRFLSLPRGDVLLPTDESEWRGSSLDGSNADS
ncbi:hypothetical protein AJ78_08115 [Emergomyces pasteurianus Ep9510]|uniref:RING-type domain-containing protein n=1 Tax=Emergomyces pasteurianus Ep9510 TaxID=1447872 RepID=A0A1J9Q534_9EURO|nr:hypothetical protein AJ78_08115 [Emergomyces pasteurianus Ep9510]